MYGYYSIQHVVEIHLDNERGNLLSPLHGLFKLVYMTHPNTTVPTMASVTPAVGHWLQILVYDYLALITK